MEKIDLKDRKILYELDLDARQSANQIARKVGLSKDAVNYRINRLKRLGVIKHYYVVLNTLQLGFLHFSTLFRFRNLNSKIREEFVKFCKNNNRVIWCVSCYGSWDFGVSFLAKDLNEYNGFITELLHKFSSNIHEKSMSLMTDSPTYARTYLIPKKQGFELEYKISETTKIDDTDRAILSAISQNANANVIDLSKQLKLSVDIIRYRIKKLIKLNIIQGFRIAIDLDKVGYLYYKLLFALKDLTLEKEEKLREYCKLNPNIVQFIKYLGNWEIQLELEVESESQLYSIIEDIRNNFGDIIKTYDILKLKEEKLDYYPIKR